MEMTAMEPDGRPMKDRIEAARREMAALENPEWLDRIKLHLALFPASALRLNLGADRIEIVPLSLPAAV